MIVVTTPIVNAPNTTFSQAFTLCFLYRRIKSAGPAIILSQVCNHRLTRSLHSDNSRTLAFGVVYIGTSQTAVHIYWMSRKDDERRIGVVGQRTDTGPLSRLFSLLFLVIIPLIVWTLFMEPSAQSSDAESVSNVVKPEQTGVIHYFYSPGCGECKLAEGILRNLEDYMPQAKIQSHNMFEPGVMEMREGFDTAYDVPLARRGIVPAVFAGTSWFIGIQELEIARDEGWLAEASYETPLDPSAPDREAITQRFASFNLGIVLGAGFIDGINPCAFAGLTFLISYLLMSGSDRKNLFYTGLGFCMAMFITYLAIGTGILSVIKRIQAISWIVTLLSAGVGLLAIVLGLLSLVDTIRAALYRDNAGFALRLPKRISKSIRSTIRKHINPRSLLAGSMVTGFLVAAMEFLCTGQVYLPTIVYVHSVYPGDPRAMLYLIVYNLAFLAPAVGIFLAAYFGMGSRVLARLAAKSIVTVKLLTSLLFLGLGGYLLYSVW